MKYELGALEQMISTCFNDREKDSEQHIQLPNVDAFEKETERIASVFLRIVFLSVSEATRRRYIHHHQHRLQYISERLGRYMEQNTNWLQVTNATEGYERLLRSIEKLLSIIEEYYADEMMMDCTAPRSYNQRITSGVHQGLSAMEQQLIYFKTDKNLVAIVIDSFEQFMTRTPYQLSCYGQIYMMRDIMQSIITYAPVEQQLSATEKDGWLIEILCRYNFNRLSFYKFCKDWVAGYLLGGEDKLYRFRRCCKFFSRLKVQPGYGWNLQRMTISNMLGDHFHDRFLAEKWTIRQSFLVNGGSVGSGEKLNTSLTVDQLGLLIRLLSESDVIRAKSAASVIRFFTHHTATIGKAPGGELSYDYLKNMYTRSSLSTIEKIDDRLQQMTGLLRKMKVEARKTNPGSSR